MPLQDLKHGEIEDLINLIRAAPNLSELWERDAIRKYIEPMLCLLGWDTADDAQVIREFQIGMGRVDFLLIAPHTTQIPLEAKRPSQNLRDHERQLLLYAFEEGMPFAALTNVRQWWLYSAMADGNWRTRKYCEIDLLQDDVSVSISRLVKYLSRSHFKEDPNNADIKKALAKWRSMNPKFLKQYNDENPASLQPKTNKMNITEYENIDSENSYPNPHAHGTKMRQVFEALRESWVTGNYLTDLTGQKGGWPRWIQKHYVESGRYGEIVMLWKKRLTPSSMHLAFKEESERLLANPEISIYPD